MSQHLFDAVATQTDHNPTPGPVNILCGWDRPLQHHFLLIEDMSIEAKQQEYPVYLFDNLMERRMGSMDVADVMDTLAQFGVMAPNGLREALHENQLRNVGNEVKHW